MHISAIFNHIFTVVMFTIYGYVKNSHSDQLADGLIAQLVEHCNGIAGVMAWVRIPFRFELFSDFNFTTASGCVHIAATFKNVFISLSAGQTYDLSYLLLKTGLRLRGTPPL